MALITDMELTKTPKKNDIWLSDDAPRGHGRFCARITPGGQKLFYFKYTLPSGKREYIPLGAYDKKGVSGLTLKAARAESGKLSLLYQSGVTDIKGHNEAEQRLTNAKRATEEALLAVEQKAAEIEAARLSVQGLFEKWEDLRISKRKDGGKEIRRLFEKDVLSAIGSLPAHLVRKGHVMEITDTIEGRGAARTAKIVFASIRQMFRFALARDFVEHDPTAALNKSEIGGKDVERERTLSDEEIRLLAKQMPSARMSPTAEAAIWIALATCCRIGELLKARWEHIDLDHRRWTIIPENSKNAQPIDVYLSDFALHQFRILQQHRRSTWVYPARNKDKGDTHTCTKTITKQIGDRQRTDAPMKNRSANTGTLILSGGYWTPHDLRRTASTIMGDLGIKPEVIDRCQNHKEQNRIRRTYQRYSYQPEMKQAWQLLGERLEALTATEESAKIITLRRREK